MITAALIRPDFVADTLRHDVIEITLARPVPHRVTRLVPADTPLTPLPTALQPFARRTATAKGIRVALQPGVRPMALKYPETARSPKNTSFPPQNQTFIK
ncbi:MAG: hypothetical protein ACTTJL_06760 [Hoylesella enoeca]|uniref:hypothetical protein n=1 Tax=Hoylesella enoeca TaxID=76123 RepID=UPI003FA064F5